MVALTGIEPDGCQFSPVQLGLSGCVFSPVGIPGCSETPPRTADVTAQSQRSRGPRGAGEAAELREIADFSMCRDTSGHSMARAENVEERRETTSVLTIIKTVGTMLGVCGPSLS